MSLTEGCSLIEGLRARYVVGGLVASSEGSLRCRRIKDSSRRRRVEGLSENGGVIGG